MPLKQDAWIDDGTKAYLPVPRNVDVQAMKLIAACCDNGAAFPTSPAEGQWFVFEPGSRRVLYQRINSLWVPIFQFGAATITVAKTGNDTTGTGEVGAPYLTWQKVFDDIPDSVGGSVVINVGAGVYTENPTLRGKKFTGNFLITIQGHATYTGSPETITGADGGTVGTAPPSQALATITRSSGSWTVDAYKGMIINIAGTVPSTINVNRVVKSNTANTITLCGIKLARVVDAADVITIYPQSSVGGTEDTRLAGNLTFGVGQESVFLNDVRIQPASGTALTAGGDVVVNRCVLLDFASVVVPVSSAPTFLDCFMRPTGSSVAVVSSTGARAYTSIFGSYLLNNGTGSTRGLRISGFSRALIGSGSVIENGVIGGLFITDGAMVYINSSSATPGLILENCTIPVSASFDGFYSMFNGVVGALSIVGGGTSNEQGISQPIAFAQTTQHKSVAAPATPLAGHVWNDSTRISLMEFTNGLKKTMDGTFFCQTANATVGNSAAKAALSGTGIGTLTLPAAWWLIGKSLRITASGFYSATTLNALTLRLECNNGATITLTAAGTPVLATNRAWSFDIILTARSATTATGHTFVMLSGGAAAVPSFFEFSSGTGTATVAVGIFLLTAQWAGANAGDTITCTNFHLEELD